MVVLTLFIFFNHLCVKLDMRRSNLALTLSTISFCLAGQHRTQPLYLFHKGAVNSCSCSLFRVLSSASFFFAASSELIISSVRFLACIFLCSGHLLLVILNFSLGSFYLILHYVKLGFTRLQLARLQLSCSMFASR